MRSDRSGERGLALVIVMFMVMTMSLVGASLVFVSRTETLSSLSYLTVTQTRYAAEAGISAATNYFLNVYAAPTAGGADPIAAYDITQSPVVLAGTMTPVVLSTVAADSTYPYQPVKDAFALNAAGILAAAAPGLAWQGRTAYSASAQLLTMRQMTDSVTGAVLTLQTWRITGTGSADGAGAASVQVSAVLEINDKPVFQYAAFATNNGCGALSFAGGAQTDSYDSRVPNSWNNPSLFGGDVGTNGSLTEGNNSAINGSLSTPRSGVGACAAGNVVAANAGATITGGITQLSQAVTFPTPPQPSPLPPTTVTDFKKTTGCPAGVANCVASTDGATIHPPTSATVVTMGNVNMNAGTVLHLSAGVYVVNSLHFNGNASIVIDGAGPIVFKVAGVGDTSPIDFSGGTVINTTFDPAAMQILYGGTGTVTLTGGSDTSGLVIAPNANVKITGGGDFYGAVIAGTVDGIGGAAIHYDRSMQSRMMTVGNPILHDFTWRSY